MNTNPKKTINLAVDPGFHAIKVAGLVDQTMTTTLLPSLVGVGALELGLLSTGGLTRTKRRQKPQVFATAEHTMLVGPHVAQYARTFERFDFDKFGYAPELRALTLTALANWRMRAQVTTEDFNLVVALPVQVLQSSTARATVKALEDWLVGEHLFTLDDLPQTFRIHAVKAMAQPLGTFFAWGLHTQGQWTRPPADLKAHVGVLDQGFNTLDLFTLQGGQIVRRYTGGETLGMRRAAQLMQALVAQTTGRKLSLHEADRYVRQNGRKRGGQAHLMVRGELFPLAPLAKQAENAAFSEVRAFLSQQWEDGSQFDYILLTGGGALVLGKRLQAAFPAAFTLPDPVTANARGFAKFAQRPGLF